MGNFCCNENFNSAICPVEYTEAVVGPPQPRNTYMFYNAMDNNNKKAMDVWQNVGIDAAVKHMTTTSDGNPRSYAEMRELYG